MNATTVRPGSTRRITRVAVYLDLENLVPGRTRSGVAELAAALRRIASRGTLAGCVACCDPALARAFAFAVADVGVRTFTHAGGPDAADRELIARVREQLPPSCDTVVIGSGDHIFEPLARELRSRGLRVEVLARAGSIAAGLYRAAHRVHLLTAERCA